MSETPLGRPAVDRRKNGLAIATLIVGIMAFLTGIVPGWVSCSD